MSGSCGTRCEELEVAGQKVVRLHTNEGDEQALAEIYLHGAHVTRFEKAGQRPYFFLSERAVLDGSKPIRGGWLVYYLLVSPWATKTKRKC